MMARRKTKQGRKTTLPLFLCRVLKSVEDLDRIRDNRLGDLARYYAGLQARVCPHCLREQRSRVKCSTCGHLSLPAAKLARMIMVGRHVA